MFHSFKSFNKLLLLNYCLPILLFADKYQYAVTLNTIPIVRTSTIDTTSSIKSYDYITFKNHQTTGLEKIT